MTPRVFGRALVGAFSRTGSFLLGMAKPLPQHLRFALLVMGINLAIFLLMRAVFLGVFGGEPTPFDEGSVAKSIWLGVRFDVRLAVLVVAPVTLLGWLPWAGIARNAFGRVFWLTYLLVALTGVLFLYVVDFGHFAYLNTRVNSTVLVYLQNPGISATMAWETYPVVWAGLGLAVFVAAYGWCIWRLAARTLVGGTPKPRRWVRGLATTVCIVLLLFSVYGKLAYNALEWKDAFYTQRPFLMALGLNPALYFFSTLEKGGKKFDEQKVRTSYDLMAEYLGVDKPDREKLDFARWRQPKPKLPGTPNVVVIIMESFAAFKVGAFGNPLKPTPNFDRLAQQGWLFKNFFVPGGGTARSIFSALFGVPDVTRGVAFSRNPLAVDHHTIIDELEGYEKRYFIGGDANWRNIRGLVHQNIRGARIYEEMDFDKPHNDGWGISDTDLFEEANRILAHETDKPFFAVIQTASNHAPYTIPDDSRGFELKEPALPNPKDFGFNSTKEFNSLRYLDHALGFYMGLAQKEDYFKNTLFVMFGDHGRPGMAKHFRPGMVQHKLTFNIVPLLFFGSVLPGKAREIEEIASELDVIPTVAGLLGKPYRNRSLGRDLFEEGGTGPRYAFVMDQNQNPPRFGLVDREFFFVLDSDRRSKMFRYLSDDPGRNLVAELAERAALMERYTRGFYETARYMLFKERAAPVH